MKTLLSFLVMMVIAGHSAATDTLRIGTLKFGTVNWELDTIKREGFDVANGFDLDIQGFAGSQAAKVAFQAGELDAIVSDWIWVARLRAAGRDLVFIPYSRAVGSLMVPADSPVETLADMVGRKIGIAGGPLDKSWLVLRAFAQKKYGIDLKDQTDQVFGAPPLIFNAALQGETDGSINFWNYIAKMEARGFRPVLSVAEAATELGLDPDTPLLGYVITGELARTDPDLVRGLIGASRAAKDLLATDDAAWEKLRGQMNAADDAEFDALVAGFREGIPSGSPVDLEAAARFFDLMAELGGEELVGSAKTIPEGIFLTY